MSRPTKPIDDPKPTHPIAEPPPRVNPRPDRPHVDHGLPGSVPKSDPGWPLVDLPEPEPTPTRRR